MSLQFLLILTYSMLNVAFLMMVMVMVIVPGLVSVLRTLDRETISVYRLGITATDSGTPARSSQTTLSVYVDDVNDNAPVFLPRTYHAVVDEEQDPPIAVVTVFASDFDDPTSIVSFRQFTSMKGH